MIYGWRPLHPDLPSYDSSHFLSQLELSQWIPRSFTRNKFISKDLYIVRKKISNDQEKFIFLLHPISNIQEKEMIVNKNIFAEHFVYYDAILNQEVLQDYYLYFTLWFSGAVNVAFLATKTAHVNKCCQKGNKNSFTSRFY